MKRKAKQKVVKQVSINLIKPYWRNPRLSDSAVPIVAESIKRYGFNVPIVIDGKGVIIAGHTRYRAARQLGLKKVPTIRLDVSEAKARQFRIADNKTSELAKWNSDMLAKELLAMSDLDTVRALFGGPMWDAILHLEEPSEPQVGTPPTGHRGL